MSKSILDQLDEAEKAAKSQPICRGSFVFGSSCLKCPKCKMELIGAANIRALIDIAKFVERLTKAKIEANLPAEVYQGKLVGWQIVAEEVLAKLNGGEA